MCIDELWPNQKWFIRSLWSAAPRKMTNTTNICKATIAPRLDSSLSTLPLHWTLVHYTPQYQPKHRGRNQIYSFHHLLGRPQGPQGCQKLRHYPLNLNLEVWCSNIEPKLNELQKTLRSYQKWLIFGRVSQFFQFWLNIRAPNLQIQVQWIMTHLLTPKRPLGASK